MSCDLLESNDCADITICSTSCQLCLTDTGVQESMGKPSLMSRPRVPPGSKVW